MPQRDWFKTRIREVRKDQGLTLQELAERIGTTAQSVQRLETGKTKVSLDWLDRFASALDVPMADLIAAPQGSSVIHLGEFNASGRLIGCGAGPSPTASSQLIQIPARDPVAARLAARIGPYPEGSLVIADRRTPGDASGADGRNCVVALTDERIILRRIVIRSAGHVTLVPLESGDPVEHDLAFAWLAPIVMIISYL